MKSVLRSLVALCSLGLAAPLLHANLTPGSGEVLYSTATYVGSISPGQTLILDLPQETEAKVEMRVVNDATNQVVRSVIFSEDLESAGAPYYENVEVTGLNGSYRVEIDLVCPDYSTSTFTPWHQFVTYFDAQSGYGCCAIDVGASVSDVRSWGGANLIVQ